MRDQTRIMGPDPRFHTTSWTLVKASRDVKALDALVSIYWKPLYFYVRHRGHDNESAKDVVQEFFTTLIEKDAFSRADPRRGRFRSFLLAALSNFLKDRVRSDTREKRGGGRSILSLDFHRGEEEYQVEALRDESPQKVLDRAWARTLWSHALARLQALPAHLTAFRMYLDDADYPAISARTGLSEPAARVAIHRLKARLREIVLEHLRATAADEADARAEMREFVTLLNEEKLLASPAPK